jgi:hypothetical protein
MSNKTKRSERKVTPAQVDLHTQIENLFDAHINAGLAGETEYSALAGLIRAIPWANNDAVIQAQVDVKFVYGEDHADGAQIIVNILNNCRKVAMGGKKDDKVIQGRGIPVMLEVLDTVSSIRELKKAMAEHKPEALKGKSGGKRKGSGKESKKPGKAVSMTRSDVFAEGIKLLELIQTFLKPSDTALLMAVAQTEKMLKEAA